MSQLTQGAPLKPVESYPRPLVDGLDGLVLAAEMEIVPPFFAAICRKEIGVVALFLQSNVVTANTQYEGRTPLLAAVASKHLPTVKLLLEHGAHPDELGVYSTGWDHSLGKICTFRTPLQAAAAEGHLPLVKLLMETYGCNDAVVAPDGQIALRLAAERGHREVVAYLPARRAGGFRRWKTKHQAGLRRTRVALDKCAAFVKLFVWDVEKFVLWTIPKNAVVKPLWSRCRWAWEHRADFLPWCQLQIRQLGSRLQHAGAKLVEAIKASPRAVVRAAKYVRQHLPAFLHRQARLVWSFVTVKIPQGALVVTRWIYDGIVAVSAAVGRGALLVASLVHSAVHAVVFFFSTLTVRDLWNGLSAVLTHVFVTFPRVVWSWMCNFGDVSLRALQALFGGLGECIWLVVTCPGFLVLYLPRKILTILGNFGESLARGSYEIVVWLNPKA
ncbi:uncharacterized protein A1O5_04614 [Cladophialophora psammophila CBS 110553]|uniref:Uncharacterized protein n=1 Tax=Cladophialophora psammophila CBS 110553 TaxID=1182543 RepID=W9X481_9EURO|nr:uncharacterized protein A1O5_04614 [Cladophialophora psammophila CBS 110553]EXJ72110.1 hypothetical protein A1O5_04614 [Cladophialophora psammophila CBS 110553]